MSKRKLANGCLMCLVVLLPAACAGNDADNGANSYDGEDVPILCRDGKDNDGDGLTDCDDPDCGSLYTCAQIDTNGGDSTDSDGLALQWMRIATGDFSMGQSDGDPSEAPAHVVYAPHYEILRTEVTVSQYLACVEDGACENITADAPCASEDYQAIVAEDPENFPMNCVSWPQAVAFCEWVGARLPTEAEWENVASSGMKERGNPWGDEPADCDLAVIDGGGGAGCGIGHPLPVCSREAGNSASGLCDLIGNVQEWTEDDVHQDYVGAPNKSIAWIESPRTEGRIVRGGAYFDGPEVTAMTRRWCDLEDGCDIADEMDGYGFRCAR